MKVHLDGELIEAQAARVSAFDAGYLYGDGIFDTLRSYSGFVFLLAEHVQRLAREAELLQIPLDPSPGSWEHDVRALLEANDLAACDARIRIQVSRGGSPETDHVGGDPELLPPVVFITARTVSEHIARAQNEGVRVCTMQSSFARGNFPQIKSLNYLPSIMALRFARAQGYEEAVLVNRQNKLLEGSSSNLFLINGDTLRTPSPRLGLLPGITRSVVLEIARELEMKVEEAASELRDLVTADEVFLTGSVKEIMPVIGLDHGVVGGGRPGDWTRRLQRAYRDRIENARSSAATS